MNTTFTPGDFRRVPTSRTTGVIELRYAPQPVYPRESSMGESNPTDREGTAAYVSPPPLWSGA